MLTFDDRKDTEACINQAFAHIGKLAHCVHGRNYDLLGPDNAITMPQPWEDTIESGMQITMMMWPFREHKDEEAPNDKVSILDEDDIPIPGGGGNSEKNRRKKASGKGFSSWMLGGMLGERVLKKPAISLESTGEFTDN